MSGNMVTSGRGCYWHLTGRGWDAANHPSAHRTASHENELLTPKDDTCWGWETVFGSACFRRYKEVHWRLTLILKGTVFSIIYFPSRDFACFAVMGKLLFQKEIHVPMFMFSAWSLRWGSVLLACFFWHCPLSASSLYELDPCSQWRERPLLLQVLLPDLLPGPAPRSGREPGSLAQSIPSGPGPRPRPVQEPRQAVGAFLLRSMCLSNSTVPSVSSLPLCLPLLLCPSGRQWTPSTSCLTSPTR